MAIVRYKNSAGEWVPISTTTTSQGSSPVINMTVQMGAVGSSPKVTTTGTSSNPIINLTIPNAPMGEQGPVGTLENESSYLKKSGNQGDTASYCTPYITSNNLTINQDSCDVNQVNGVVKVIISNGSEDTSWTKTVMLTNSNATVELGSAWNWVGGVQPTITSGCLIVLCWMHDVGFAQIVEGLDEDMPQQCRGVVDIYDDYYDYEDGSDGFRALIYRGNDVIYNTQGEASKYTISCVLQVGDRFCFLSDSGDITNSTEVDTRSRITLDDNYVITDLQEGFYIYFTRS